MTARRLGEGSWIDDGYMLPYRTITDRFMVWTPIGDGHVLRYLDRDYQLRVR